MSLLSWLGRKVGLSDARFWRQFFGVETWSGEHVSAEVAMQVGAFWACTKLLAGAMSLPMNLYTVNTDGSRKLLPNDDLHRLVHDSPNGDQTAIDFWEGMGSCLCVYGNAFAEKLLGSTGQLVGLLPMAAERTVVQRTPEGVLQYRYFDPLRNGGAERILRPSQVLHIRGFGFGGDIGLSTLAFARQSLGAARAVERTAASTFANGLRPSGWLVYKGGTLDTEQREQARKQLIEPMQGAGSAGKTGILEADFDYKSMSIPPEDAQMLQTRQFTVEDVCRWFGVPPVLVGHASAGQTMWGSGIEQILIGWLTLGCMPWLRRVEQSVSRSLLPPERRPNTCFEYDVDSLLRADSASRATLHSNYAQNGIMTRNEIRSKLNLPKEPGGDVLTVQVNLTPLEKLANSINDPAAVPPQLQPGANAAPQPDPTQVRAAFRAWLGLDEELQRQPLRVIDGSRGDH